jgi:hypothetical protein
MAKAEFLDVQSGFQMENHCVLKLFPFVPQVVLNKKAKESSCYATLWGLGNFIGLAEGYRKARVVVALAAFPVSQFALY